MSERDWLAEQFEAHRTHLRAVAHRMLGSHADADDAVQEVWLRLSRSDPSAVENLRGWLTTVAARVCLDVLRQRASRREAPLDGLEPNPVTDEGSVDPEDEVLLADSVGLGMQVVLQTLTPAERVTFILHDVFAVPFEEIAPIVGRSTISARQLASRARRRVQGTATTTEANLSRQRTIVDAFLAASRSGDFTGLLRLLDPDAVLRADDAAVRMGASREVRGAAAVAETFAGRARFAQPAMVDGAAGAVWAPGGRPRVVFEFTIIGGKVVAIDLVADPEQLSGLELADLD